MTIDRRPGFAPAPYQSRIDAWLEKISEYSQIGKSQDKLVTSEWEQGREIDRLLGEGGQVFFDILEPFKDLGWFKADNPDIYHEVYFRSTDPRLRGLDRDMFGGLTWGRRVTIHGYRKGFGGGDENVIVTLGCNEQGRHGEKVIDVHLNRHYSKFPPDLIMRIEDRVESWVDPGEKGAVVTLEEKNLKDMSGLEICRLAVSLAHIFAEEYPKKHKGA